MLIASAGTFIYVSTLLFLIRVLVHVLVVVVAVVSIIVVDVIVVDDVADNADYYVVLVFHSIAIIYVAV